MLDVSLLGTGGMVPLHRRYLSALLLRYQGHMVLIDCGEGTQMTMRELGWGFVHLDAILFTHFHADHIAGLPGMLLSLGNYGRTEPLTIAGPIGIEDVVNRLRVIAPELMYPISFIEFSADQKPADHLRLHGLQISALPLDHGLPCLGYSVSVPRGGMFDPRRAKAQNIPVAFWSRLQNGEPVAGFTPDMVLGEPRKGIKVSYITDTKPMDTIPAFIEGSDLFLCEGLYGEDDRKLQADRFGHMVFADAARLAKAGNVKQLWLTHYSQALADPENHIPGARNIFEHTFAGFDRKTISIGFDNGG